MLEVATVAARLGGQRAIEELKYIKTSIKNGNEIVTQADTICQQVIMDRIKENYPDHGFIAEEGTDGGMLRWEPRGAEKIWWVIDPIDGSNNFSHRLLCFCVSIAVFHENQPIVGVIFDPATESMYTAVQGMEAQLNSSRIRASDEDISEFVSIGIDSHYTADMEKGIGDIAKQTRFRNLGTTALHMAYVASGAMVGMVSTVTKIWDIAAGAVIVESAGGMLTDIGGAKLFPIDLAKYGGEEYRILAANKKTHEKIAKMFR
jgi:myo-inositol-1(or 4)-monophosphatase